MSEDRSQSNANTPRQLARRTRQLSSTQITFAIILAVGLMLAVQFSTRITQDRDLQQMQSTVLREIELLQQEQQRLIEQLTYAESDAFVESWARGEGRMVREGEVLVIPIPSSTGLLTANQSGNQVPQLTDAEIETTLPEPENWLLWWGLFFDAPPPSFG